jgi:hypothetical protein
MARSHSEEAVKVATELYNASNVEERRAMLDGLAHKERFGTEPLDDSWAPFITTTAREPDPRLRRAAAALLSRITTKEAAKVIDTALADDDSETHSAAAQVLLSIVAGKKTTASSYEETVFGEDEAPFTGASGFELPSSKTNEPIVTAARLAAWHETLSKRARANATSDVMSAAALYVTGDGRQDVPLLAKAMEQADTAAAQKLVVSPAMSLILPKLPWPEGEPVLDSLTRSPALFAAAAVKSQTGAPPVRAWFTNAVRLRTTLEKATGDDLAIALTLLLRPGLGIALLRPSAEMNELAVSLAQSTNVGCRAAGSTRWDTRRGRAASCS